MDEGLELAKVAQEDGQEFDWEVLVAQGAVPTEGSVQAGGGEGTNRAGNRSRTRKSSSRRRARDGRSVPY